jgi:O-antigen/teichoic acid export membrane protein
LARNAVINTLGQGIPLLVGVLTAPTVVRGLGSDRYGILAMALAVLGYFSLFDLGLGRAATRFVAAALGSGSEDKVPSIVWTAVMTQAFVGVIGTLFLIIVTPPLVERVLNISPELWQEARPTFYILAVSIPAVLVSGSLRGVLEASQRFDLVNLVASPLSTANFLLPYIAVSLGWKLPAIVGVLLASRIIGAVLFFLFCIKVFPSLRKIPRFHPPAATALIGFGGWVTVSSVVSPALIYLDRFMLGMLTTMTAVTYYAAPYEMVTRLLIVPFSLAAILFPAFSELHQKGNTLAVGALAATSLKFLLLTFAPLVVALLAFSREILGLWLGADFARQSTHAVQILAIGLLANAIAQLPFALIQGAGRPDLTAKIHLLEIPVQVIVAWTCVKAWGITGAALAWSTRSALDLMLLSFAASRAGLVSWRLLLSNRLPQVLVCIAIVGVIAVASVWTVHSAILRASIVALSLALVGIVTWSQYLSDEDRARITQLLPQFANARRHPDTSR